MKIAIIGAGISGAIAYGAFKSVKGAEIKIFDSKESKKPLSAHKAIMRLRNDKIKKYVNCDLERISVYKAIYHDGRIYDRPNILLNNLYSLKVYDSIGERSLSTLGKVDRFIIKDMDGISPDVLVNKKVIDVLGNTPELKQNKLVIDGEYEPYAYDICISTMPLPILMNMCGIEHNIAFTHTPIFVLTADLKIKSSVHQTLYFTDKNLSVPYRATIQENRFIAESIEHPYKNDWKKCLDGFGLDYTMLENISIKEQKMGKLNPIDDTLRRKIMMDITDEFNIYSFGRFATWRPLRIDQTIDDIDKIKLLIKIKNREYYEIFNYQ